MDRVSGVIVRTYTSRWTTGAPAGEGLAEYALILGLIAVVAIVALIFLRDTLADLISLVGDMVG
jgi:Flp pilus assembly pilin Flp